MTGYFLSSPVSKNQKFKLPKDNAITANAKNLLATFL